VILIWTWTVHGLGLAVDTVNSWMSSLPGLNMIADCSWTWANRVRDLNADCSCLKIACGHGQITEAAIARTEHGRGRFVDADESYLWPACGQFMSTD
jgi:hypothetical protein